MDITQVLALASPLLVELTQLAAAPGRFRRQYQRLEEDLRRLEPILTRLRPAQFNDDALVRELRNGGELIERCRRVSRWNLPKQKKYSRRLKKLDEEINRFVRVHTMQNYLEELAPSRSGIRRFFSCFACSSPAERA